MALLAHGTGHREALYRIHRIAPCTVQHRTRTGVQPVPMLPAPVPSTLHGHQEANRCKRDGKGMEMGPGDTVLPTWTTLLRRRGCVPAWFTVHGPRDWLA